MNHNQKGNASNHNQTRTSQCKKPSNGGGRSRDGVIGRAQSTLNMSAADYYLNLTPPSPAVSTVTLTPGRIRNIDQDMQALRASRQDNPYLQQVIASRESLAELVSEEESDDTNLMARELSLDLDVDPLSLPEMHEHMIRSPPPIEWPISPSFFSGNEDEMLRIELDTKGKTKSGYKSMSSLRSTTPVRSQFSLLTTPNSLKSSSIADDNVRLMSDE